MAWGLFFNFPPDARFPHAMSREGKRSHFEGSHNITLPESCSPKKLRWNGCRSAERQVSNNILFLLKKLLKERNTENQKHKKSKLTNQVITHYYLYKYRMSWQKMFSSQPYLRGNIENQKHRNTKKQKNRNTKKRKREKTKKRN